MARTETITVTKNELLEALAEAAKGSSPKEAKTVQELSEETKLGIPIIRKALQAYARAGRLSVYRVQRTGISGVAGWVPAYLIKSK